jgi:hypothetical protein
MKGMCVDVEVATQAQPWCHSGLELGSLDCA